MKARLKNNAPMGTLRSAGEIFTHDWREVPAWAEAEITDNFLLETDTHPDASAPENEPVIMPPLTKLVVPKKGRGKTL
jgi:hypothetical protein